MTGLESMQAMPEHPGAAPGQESRGQGAKELVLTHDLKEGRR